MDLFKAIGIVDDDILERSEKIPPKTMAQKNVKNTFNLSKNEGII